MIPSRDRLPPEAAVLSDAEIERIYALPPLDTDTTDIIRRLLRGPSKTVRQNLITAEGTDAIST